MHGDEDRFVSRSIRRSGSWERDTGNLIGTLLTKFLKDDAIFLDIGANLGIHALFAARLGFKVWAIEPQIQNLKKVSRYL